MSYPAIYRFVDKVRGISHNSRDFTMSVAEAKALQSEITKLLLSLETLRDVQVNTEPTVQKIELKGGEF